MSSLSWPGVSASLLVFGLLSATLAAPLACAAAPGSACAVRSFDLAAPPFAPDSGKVSAAAAVPPFAEILLARFAAAGSDLSSGARAR